MKIDNIDFKRLVTNCVLKLMDENPIEIVEGKFYQLNLKFRFDTDMNTQQITGLDICDINLQEVIQ
jgi:hypothetical protein